MSVTLTVNNQSHELDVDRTAGFVRVAFRLAFWHAAHTPSWRDALVVGIGLTPYPASPRGDVDYAGTSALAANTAVIAEYPATKLAKGPVTLSVSNDTSSFVRTQVLDSDGKVIALSNPAWLFRAPPSGGIPAPRQA